MLQCKKNDRTGVDRCTREISKDRLEKFALSEGLFVSCYMQYTQHYQNNMGVADDCNKNVLFIRFEAITSAVFDPFSWECKYMTLTLVWQHCSRITTIIWIVQAGKVSFETTICHEQWKVQIAFICKSGFSTACCKN